MTTFNVGDTVWYNSPLTNHEKRYIGKIIEIKNEGLQAKVSFYDTQEDILFVDSFYKFINLKKEEEYSFNAFLQNLKRNKITNKIRQLDEKFKERQERKKCLHFYTTPHAPTVTAGTITPSMLMAANSASVVVIARSPQSSTNFQPTW